MGGRRTEKGWRQREEGREDGDDAQVGGSATSGVLMFVFIWPLLVLLRSQLCNVGPAVQLRLNLG